MECKYKRIAVKIGSNVLTRKDGTLDVTRMSALVDQVAELHRAGVEIVLVSSGAVASGRSEVKPLRKLDSVDSRQLFSAVGQAKLINRYYELFREHGITVGQVLTTKESFSTRRENDTISVTELMFTDNDELSGLIAAMMDVQALVILSNIDGIYNGAPSQPGVTVIREVEQGKDLSDYISTEKSGFGRGGMLTKSSIARKVADEGITVFIANGKKDNILVDLISNPEETICTKFVPSENGVSSIKKWIAHSGGFSKGKIIVNHKAADKLRGDKAVSLLPVGVTDIVGDFEKDDIVTIVNPDDEKIGVGRVSMSSADAKAVMGVHGKPYLVHYDYLYLE